MGSNLQSYFTNHMFSGHADCQLSHTLPGHRFICLTYLEPDMIETNDHVRNTVGMTRFELAPALRMLCIPNAARLTNSSTSRF